MEKRVLAKPDGRPLILYSRRPFASDGDAPQAGRGVGAGPHLRWHPLRGEWVAYATHRQDRTFLPEGWNPLAPQIDPRTPTEVPAGDWDVAVFPNLFPTLVSGARNATEEIVPTRPARGEAEVVVFTPDPTASLATLPLEHLELLVEVWADRYLELGAREDVEYVFLFENRGVEVGVTLHHPHGQIYAYPFVPPIPATELSREEAHFEEHGRGLLEDLVDAEIDDGRRMVYSGSSVVAFVPVCARYAYEVWIVPRRRVPSVAELEAEERRDFARALGTVLSKYDGLWSRPFPYVMAFHQAPTDGVERPAHLHVELYPPYRTREKLKYLAGSEIGAGVFTADTLPEEKAAELRAVETSLR
jgi:UDPglucose--hexose-1-phosphate uridylyltransferase